MPKSGNRSIHILVFGQDAIERSALCSMINSWPGMTASEMPNLPGDALQLVKRSKPNIVIYETDIDCDSNCRKCPLEFLSSFASNGFNARTLLVIGAREIKAQRCAVSLGVTGIVLKEDSPEDLRRAIEKVHAGEPWLARHVIAKLINEGFDSPKEALENSLTTKLGGLSSREIQILNLVGEGLKNKEIGKHLFISDVTVRHHLTSIFNKLSVSSRLDLVIFLYQNRLIPGKSQGINSRATDLHDEAK